MKVSTPRPTGSRHRAFAGKVQSAYIERKNVPRNSTLLLTTSLLPDDRSGNFLALFIQRRWMESAWACDWRRW